MLLVLVILAAVGVRSRWVATEMWVDEAETTINALTILDHGIPTDTYLGQPIYENTLSERWPASEEYEFRDTSYSHEGVAVWHGWLPMYAIAGTCRLFGIVPDHPVQPLAVQHDLDEFVYRSVVPRLPSLLFSGIMLAVVFCLGRDMGGRATGWAAVILLGFAASPVWFGWHARYYAATLCLTALAAWSLWRVMRFGAWRDHLMLGLSLGLLFHTHLLSAAVACAMTGLLTPWTLRHGWHRLPRLIVAAGILFLLSVPWLLLTGFFDSADNVPKAWRVMDLPWDTFEYPLAHRGKVLLLGIALVTAAGAVVLHRRVGWVRAEPFYRHVPALLFLTLWAVAYFLAFTFIMPVGSYFFERLTLGLVLPCQLIAAVLLAAAGEALWPRQRLLITSMICVLGIYFAGWLPDLTRYVPRNYIHPFFAHVHEHPPTPDARLYSTPNHHLIFTYYTGLPVQSVAPVHKAYIDAYPGPVWFIDTHYIRPAEVDAVREAAAAAGVELTPNRAEAIADDVRRHLLREWLIPQPAAWDHAPEPLPAWVEPVLETLRAERDAGRAQWGGQIAPQIVFRDYYAGDYRDWWQIFFYMTVDPETRRLEHANYVDRLRNASLTLLPEAELLIYKSPHPIEPEANRQDADGSSDAALP